MLTISLLSLLVKDALLFLVSGVSGVSCCPLSHSSLLARNVLSTLVINDVSGFLLYTVSLLSALVRNSLHSLVSDGSDVSIYTLSHFSLFVRNTLVLYLSVCVCSCLDKCSPLHSTLSLSHVSFCYVPLVRQESTSSLSLSVSLWVCDCIGRCQLALSL